jgi:hypothetical protein
VPEPSSDPPVTVRYTAKDLKLAEMKQVTAREDIAKGAPAWRERARQSHEAGRSSFVAPRPES